MKICYILLNWFAKWSPAWLHALNLVLESELLCLSLFFVCLAVSDFYKFRLGHLQILALAQSSRLTHLIDSHRNAR